VNPIQICNLALSWLGANRILSFDENSNESRLCADVYEPLRQAVLEERAWTFAEDIRRLSSPLSPTLGDEYAYELPTDILRAYRVYDNNGRRLEFRRQGSQLLVSGYRGPIYVRGTVDLQESSRFTPGFTQALAARMAADLAIALTRSRQLQADMWVIYNAKLSQAAANDATQATSERTDSTELTGARYR
jgi:hypothetical protein